MATRYEPKTAEPRQQARWAAADAFSVSNADTGRPTYYVLEMFPYPSGNIHMGHARNYVMGDVVARSKRAQGFDVTVYEYPPADDPAAVVNELFTNTVSHTKENYDLVMYVAAIPQVSFGPTIRLTWSPVVAANVPHGIPEIPIVFVSFENPYHLRDVPRVRTFVNAYTDSEMTADAVADALTGAEPFRGTSPVDPFCGYEDAHW